MSLQLAKRRREECEQTLRKAQVGHLCAAGLGSAGMRGAVRKATWLRDRTKEISMRRVAAVELVSVDGVMESPEEWAFACSNDEMEEANDSGVSLVGAPSSRVGCAVEKAFGGEHRRKERP